MTPCLPLPWAVLAFSGVIVAAVALLIVAYLIETARKVRFADAALEVLGRVDDPNSDPNSDEEDEPSMDLAYEMLHEIERDHARLDALIRRGMRGLSYRERSRLFGEDGGAA